MLIDEVTEGGCADKGGLKSGDIIQKMDGKTIEDIRGYMDVLNELKIGSKIKVVVLRDGKKVEREVEVGSR